MLILYPEGTFASLIDCQCSDGGKGEICGACFSVEGEARREGVMDGYCIQCLQHQACILILCFLLQPGGGMITTQ